MSEEIVQASGAEANGMAIMLVDLVRLTRVLSINEWVEWVRDGRPAQVKKVQS